MSAATPRFFLRNSHQPGDQHVLRAGPSRAVGPRCGLSQFFPRKGWLADADVSFHSPAVGDNFSYQVYTFSINRYISFATNQVLARCARWHSLKTATSRSMP